MNFKQIEYFVEVAKKQNYTKAANKLFISQSAITKQIFLLEQELETSLFIRNNKGVKLTKAGEIFLKDALDILSKIEKSEKRIKNYNNGKIGFLNVGYVRGLERTNMLSAIHYFHQNYPQCYVEYESHTSFTLQKKMVSGELDIILTHRILKDLAYIKEKIFQSQMMVFVSCNSPLANKEFFKQEDLSSLDLISNNLDSYNEKISPKAIDSLFLQVMADKGVALLPAFAIEYTQFQNYLVGIPVKDMFEITYAVHEKDNQNPLIEKFIEFLKESFSK